MNRKEMLARIEQAGTPWDFVIIGGGATGLATAIEAASRGYRTALLEQEDFSKGTSSRRRGQRPGSLRSLRRQ